MPDGVLGFDDQNRLVVKHTSKKGNPAQTLVGEDGFGDERLEYAPPHALDGLEVRFEHAPNAQQARNVVPARPDWQPPKKTSAPAPTELPQPELSTDDQRSHAAFHNPYNFVPALPRPADGELGDHAPVGHDRFFADRWSGTLTVKIETITPLLLVDAEHADPREQFGPNHYRYPIRERDGVPEIPATSLKGALRAAYEAVTNSRFGVLDDHGTRLAYRQTTDVAPTMVPARVVNPSDEQFTVRLLPGTNPIKERLGGGDVQYAAWLPWYGMARRPTGVGDYQPGHRDPVRVHLKRDASPRRNIPHWRVTRIEPAEPAEVPSYEEGDDGTAVATGWVCWTNDNIHGKYSERVFFGPSQGAKEATSARRRRVATDYRLIVESYRAAHKREKLESSDQRDDQAGHEWSRHMVLDTESELRTDDLCYVTLTQQNGEWRVARAYPVVIGRDLFDAAPADLLDESLRVAEQLDELSPADRVFGWTHPHGHGSYRGHVRVGPVRCNTDHAIQRFDDEGLALAILGQPKPQQFRFYAAKDPAGNPIDDGVAKDEGYGPCQGLRGRKVYPHHRDLPHGYWDDPVASTHVSGRPREYRNLDAENERTDQNRSITGWVKPHVEFDTELEVTNLSDVELGALLWLLTRKDGCHRLGGAKPFGLGSVRITAEDTSLRRGSSVREAYSAFGGLSAAPAEDPTACVNTFEDALRSEYGTMATDAAVDSDREPFPSFVESWLRAALGLEGPIHYPRTGQPDRNGVIPADPESYRWFVTNELTGRNAGPHVTLRHLLDDPGLPAFER